MLQICRLPVVEGELINGYIMKKRISMHEFVIPVAPENIRNAKEFIHNLEAQGDFYKESEEGNFLSNRVC